MKGKTAGAIALAAAVWAGPAHAAVDHGPFDRLLRAHVRNGHVDYAALATPTNRQALQAYLAAVASANEADEGAPPGRLAAWINAYNALVLDAVLQGKSPAALLSRFAFFKVDTYAAFGRRLTLHAMENEVIRPTFKEPRVHFALVCASKSCPPLRSEAYRGPRLDDQLDDQARRFVADPAKNAFDAANQRLGLSMIFKWYADDFAPVGGVRAYLAQVAPPAVRPWLTEAAITYREYDWSLNGTK